MSMILKLVGDDSKNFTALDQDGNKRFEVSTVSHGGSAAAARTDVYDADGLPLAAMIWSGPWPTEIRIGEDKPKSMGGLIQVVPGSSAFDNSIAVEVGDGSDDMLFLISRKAMKVVYPAPYSFAACDPSELEYAAELSPRQYSVGPFSFDKRKQSADLITIHDIPAEEMGKFWVGYILLEQIRRNRFGIPRAAPSNKSAVRLSKFAEAVHSFSKSTPSLRLPPYPALRDIRLRGWTI